MGSLGQEYNSIHCGKKYTRLYSCSPTAQSWGETSESTVQKIVWVHLAKNLLHVDKLCAWAAAIYRQSRERVSPEKFRELIKWEGEIHLAKVMSARN